MRSGFRAALVVMSGLVFLPACSKDNDIDAPTTVCEENTLDCVPCEAGEYRCDGPTLKVCQADGQGFDAVSMCVSEALCVKGLPEKVCAAAVCNAADTRCEGAVMWVCPPGQDGLVDTECPSVESCTAGLSSGKCAAGECEGPADCTGVETECRTRTCEAGFCGFANEPVDTPCETNRVCDGQGNCVGQCNTPTDCSGVETECKKKTCETGVCGFANEPVDTPCETNRVCDGQGNCVGQCNAPVECSGQDTECRKRTCESGVCGLEDAPAGTVLTAQTQGDCKRQVCDGDGGTTSAADPADVPDDGNDCTIEGCDGINPTTDWEIAGAPCNAGGVCNGAGVCGVCVPGTKKCDGLVPQSCNSSGQWENGAPCASVCSAGVCTGSCQPGSKICNGLTSQTCNSGGQWVDGATCPYVCSAGNCTGVCVPGTRGCKDLHAKQLCGNDGQWVADGTCTATTAPFCVQGQCGCPGTAGPAMLGIPGGYCIDTTEVTRAQYKAWLDTNPSTSGQPAYCSWNTDFTPPGYWPPTATTMSWPVLTVDWCDAAAFCKAAGKRLCGKRGGGSTTWDWPNLTPANLASESQWYNVCSSGGINAYTYGNTYDGPACGCNPGGGPVASCPGCQSPVAGFEGVFDLMGDTAEWEDLCESYSGPDDRCAYRGGTLGCSLHYSDVPPRNSHGAGMGFRCCSDP